MAWNGSGTYSRVYDWTTDEANGVNPSAARFDTEADDVAAAINNCLAKDGQNAATGNINLGTNKITNLGTPSASTDAATKGYVDGLTYLTAAGLSVLGRASNTTGTLAAITAANDNEVLRRSGTAVGFGTIATGGIADGAVTTAKIADGSATAAKLGSGAATSTQALFANGSGGAAYRAIAASDLPAGTLVNGGYRTGNYYFGGCFEQANNIMTCSANSLFAFPFYVGAQATFTRIGIECTTAESSKNARLGIYNVANGVPTSLVLDAGVVSLASTGVKEITISQALAPGIYALAVITDATPSAVLRSFSASSLPALSHLIGNTSQTSQVETWSESRTYGALPSTFTKNGDVSAGQTYAIWLRVV